MITRASYQARQWKSDCDVGLVRRSFMISCADRIEKTATLMESYWMVNSVTYVFARYNPESIV